MPRSPSSWRRGTTPAASAASTRQIGSGTSWPPPGCRSRTGRMAPAGYGSSVEGIHAVTAALAAGRAERLYVERSRRGRLGPILAALDEPKVEFVDDVR